MAKIIFKPFVGSNYPNGGIFGKKILVLGESHYCDESEVYENLTYDVLQKYLHHEVNEGWMNTFKKFERALVGNTTTEDDSRRIWESLAFYNFLQVPMGDARIAGQPEDYKNAVEPFFEVLNQLQPDYLIVCGKRLWANLPYDNWTDEKSVVVDNYENPLGTYTLSNGHKVITTPVYHHPSASFSWEYCHRVFQQMGLVK